MLYKLPKIPGRKKSNSVTPEVERDGNIVSRPKIKARIDSNWRRCQPQKQDDDKGDDIDDDKDVDTDDDKDDEKDNDKGDDKEDDKVGD